MPQITSIEPQKSSKRRSASGRKERFNIFVDGRYAFSLSTESFLKNSLKKGQTLSQKDIEVLVKESEAAKLVDLALNFLTFRPRSQKEIEDYLVKKISQRENIKFAQAKESSLIVDVISKLKKYKYINDAEFAKLWVASRNRSRPKGKRLIKIELIKKGIDKEIINEILEKTSSQKDLALKAIQKKIKTWKNLTEAEFKKKAYRFLASRGFDWDEISQAVAQLEKKR